MNGGTGAGIEREGFAKDAKGIPKMRIHTETEVGMAGKLTLNRRLARCGFAGVAMLYVANSVLADQAGRGRQMAREVAPYGEIARELNLTAE